MTIAAHLALGARPRRLLRYLSAGAAVASLLLMLGAPSVGAHTELSGALPVPGETVGGTVDRIVLEFDDLLIEDEAQTKLQLRGSDGDVETIADRFTFEGNRVTAFIDSITVGGTHVVEYQVVSIDGDLNQGSYAYIYDRTADGIVFEGGGTNWFILGGAGLVMLALLGLVFGPRLPSRR